MRQQASAPAPTAMASRTAQARRVAAGWPSMAELPAHRTLLPWLERHPDFDAEFEADLADLFMLIDSVVAASDGAGSGSAGPE
ncbi:MAG TPA: hypothetical protein VHY58_21105 [Streptosporangiaceae bacterium]|jgi:hypothetical protein|nr:hypothetical protein [Streptosporangiaceae bacterium]